MTEQTQTTTQNDELTLLKARAEQMGVKHSNNITVETLKKKIEDHLAGVKEIEPQVNPFEAATGEISADRKAQMSKEELRQEIIKEAMKLVRIRVANLDPKKKDIPGEIFTTGNKYIGTVRKYVPFGDATDNGYHVPYCIYKMLKARKFLQITTRRDRRTGTNETKTRYVSEFAIEVLPPLTEEELAKLAAAQAAGGNIGNNESE